MNNDIHNTTIVYRITLEYRESDDEEETFTIVENESWIFLDKNKMKFFYEQLFTREYTAMKEESEEFGYRFSSIKTGAKNLSWLAELRDSKSFCQSRKIIVERIEVDPDFSQDKHLKQLFQQL